ncbi:MAG: hypothetical protein R3Y10_07055 [Ferrimonas sp.]
MLLAKKKQSAIAALSAVAITATCVVNFASIKQAVAAPQFDSTSYAAPSGLYEEPPHVPAAPAPAQVQVVQGTYQPLPQSREILQLEMQTALAEKRHELLLVQIKQAKAEAELLELKGIARPKAPDNSRPVPAERTSNVTVHGIYKNGNHYIAAVSIDGQPHEVKNGSRINGLTFSAVAATSLSYSENGLVRRKTI